MPIKENNKILGIIYLENNLAIGAFTEASIEAIYPIAKNLVKHFINYPFKALSIDIKK